MPTATTPSFSLGTGNFVGSQTLTITAAGDTDIFYTIDGSEPTHTLGTPSGTTAVYSGPLTIAATTVVSALGYTTSDTDSVIVSVAIGILPVPTGVDPVLTAPQVQFLQSVLREKLQEGYAVNPFTAMQSALIKSTLAALGSAV